MYLLDLLQIRGYNVDEFKSSFFRFGLHLIGKAEKYGFSNFI